ncbi:radial spoke head 1 homolog [Cephus cinctus]|uniref:Radial spoke head 1 homolog n=1 Tax=Cephus cinctus TaxID=211228 RepID=A0AAJ7W453_CEPCN|nr:radial spoke head 1 homolog [Cephus cinctus]
MIGDPGEDGEDKGNPLGEYEGERNEQGERHGQGKAILPNGDFYIGNYCKGLRHGKGLYVFRNGARYDGEWRLNVKHGQGTFWYPDGTRYEGEWKRDTKYGFGSYYYSNQDLYEGSWKKNLRHGLGTYFYASTGTKFMGTWIKDRMQGFGQLVYPRHRYHGFWQLNLPYGRGCFTFENDCMLHGYYTHIRDPEYDNVENQEVNEFDRMPKDAEDMNTKEDINKAEKIQNNFESPPPLKKGVLSLWRVRHVTRYNPDLLPPEPIPLQEEASVDSIPDKCNDDFDAVQEDLEKLEYLQCSEYEYTGEYGEHEYQEDDEEDKIPRPV